MPWYAVSTKPHQEKQAALHIKQWGIECLLPLLKVSKVIRRTRKTVIQPLFPGYLFARFDLDRHYRAVSYATGVRKVVEFGSGPVELDTAMIDAIKERLVDGYVRHIRRASRQDRLCKLKAVHLQGWKRSSCGK